MLPYLCFYFDRKSTYYLENSMISQVILDMSFKTLVREKIGIDVVITNYPYIYLRAGSDDIRNSITLHQYTYTPAWSISDRF